MPTIEFAAGNGRTKVVLSPAVMGNDLVVSVYNEFAHVGAVAVAEYDFQNNRASVSVITRLGHKDDAIAQKAAYEICRSLKRTVCVVAGVHLDNITADEIREFTANAQAATAQFLASKSVRLG